MLEAAGVTKSDIVCDVGAAMEGYLSSQRELFGVQKAIGIELDAELAEMARTHAHRRGLTDSGGLSLSMEMP